MEAEGGAKERTEERPEWKREMGVKAGWRVEVEMRGQEEEGSLGRGEEMAGLEMEVVQAAGTEVSVQVEAGMGAGAEVGPELRPEMRPEAVAVVEAAEDITAVKEVEVEVNVERDAGEVRAAAVAIARVLRGFCMCWDSQEDRKTP